MSGIEIAGLILGALPILVEAIEEYKKGVKRVKSGFQKRKVVEKLGRALRFHKTVVEEITRGILLQSGCCDIAGLSNAQLKCHLQDKDTHRTVEIFLGTKNAIVFFDALTDCMADISHATTVLASLIPGLDHVKKDTDVQAVLDANAKLETGQIQLLKRIKTIFGFESLENVIQDLDRSTASLERLTRIVISNHMVTQNLPSRKAIQLAKILQAVRQNAIKLHSALSLQWVNTCHKRHEAKVFLDDRISESKSQLGTFQRRTENFRIVFTDETTSRRDSWHEMLFLLLIDDSLTTGNMPSQHPGIQFSLPPSASSTPKRPVLDLCAAISHAVRGASFPTFYFSETKQLTMSPNGRVAVIPTYQHDSDTLRTILQDHCSQLLPSTTLPWKWRMILALKVASSFLQFIRTPWVQLPWSTGGIQIPYADTSGKPDLRHPFLSVKFDSGVSPGSAPSTQQRQAREDLLELGILLLETWHETTIEVWVSKQPAPNTLSSANRRAYALIWLNDVQNPLPELYAQAVQHCIAGLGVAHIGPTVAMEWDDPDLWKAVCQNVIEPLSKVAQI